MSDWFCEYCQETSNPMDHGCNIVTLKSRLSHLSAVNEKLVEAFKILLSVRNSEPERFDVDELNLIDGLKLADG